MQDSLDPACVSLQTSTCTMMTRGRVLSRKQKKGRQKNKLNQKVQSTFQKQS